MYYLNDQHPRYECALYTRVGNAVPYITEKRYIINITDILREIDSIERRHNRYRQIFYIDNDFYENKYSINQNGTYYKFLKRPVNDWEELDTKTEESRINTNVLKFFI